MKNIFVLLLVASVLSAPFATAEPLNLEAGKNVCGLVKKIENRRNWGSNYLVVTLDVSGTVTPYFFPVGALDMSIVTSAFIAGRKFCASMD